MQSVKAYAALGVSPAELAHRYREHAAHCLKIAQDVADLRSKLSLLDMAQAWVALAEQAEKNGETFLF